MNTAPTLRLALFVDFPEDLGYMHPTAHVRVWEAERSRWVQPNPTWVQDEQTQYADLCLRAQCDRTTPEPYCPEIGYYRVSMVQRHLAEMMVRTLERTESRMTKMGEKEGPAATFGHLVNRFARAIGAETVYVRRPEPSRWKTPGTDEYHYFRNTPADCVSSVNARVLDWLKPLGAVAI